MNRQLLSIVVVLLAGFCGLLGAQTTVSVNDVALLRAAITTANSNSTSYIIEIAGGTYFMAGASLEDANVSGDLDITKTAGTLEIRPATGATVAIDGDLLDRVFHINNGINAPVTISDLHIQRGRATDDTSSATDAFGGGIYKTGAGSLTLNNVTLSTNSAVAEPGIPGLVGAPATNGTAGTSGYNASGGGLYAVSGTVQLNDCTFLSNSVTGGQGGDGGGGGPDSGGVAGSGAAGDFGGSAHGGAIYVGGANVTFTNGVANTNSATGGGGGAGGAGGDASMFAGNGGSPSFGGPARGAGVYIQSGTINVVSVSLDGNTSTGGSGGAGGNGGNGTGTADGVTGQQGGNGGAAQGTAIFGAGGTVSVSSSTLSNNISNAGSGGVGGDGGDGADAGHGGAGGVGGFGHSAGIHLTNAAISVLQSTISGNTTTGGSGGMGGTGGDGLSTAGNGGAGGNAGQSRGSGAYIRGGTITLDNSTIAANTATDGTGGLGGNAGSGGSAGGNGSNNAGVSAGVYEDGVGGTIDAESCIFADNTASTDPDAGGNLAATNCVIENGVTPSSGSGNQTGDPAMGVLQNNGGTTETHAIITGSIALNVGSNPQSVTTDQRGTGFPRSVGAGIDVGAYEFDPAAFTAAPIVTAPTSPQTINAPSIAVTGTATTASLVRVYSDADNNGLINGPDAVVAQQQLGVGVSSFNVSTVLAQDANNDFTVTADDGSNGESPPVDLARIIEDSTAPSGPAVTDPAAPVNTAGAAYTITGTAEAGALVQIYTDNNNNGLIDGPDSVWASQQLGVAATAYSISTTISAGVSNDFTVTATDAVGNESAPVDVPTITETTSPGSGSNGGGDDGGGCVAGANKFWPELILLLTFGLVGLRRRRPTRPN
ncbi:MAG: choice-of-anchor Q domain-containing protein [Planctomycetota bacterium]|jgi:hypothetical protein